MNLSLSGPKGSKALENAVNYAWNEVCAAGGRFGQHRQQYTPIPRVLLQGGVGRSRQRKWRKGQLFELRSQPRPRGARNGCLGRLSWQPVCVHEWHVAGRAARCRPRSLARIPEPPPGLRREVQADAQYCKGYGTNRQRQLLRPRTGQLRSRTPGGKVKREARTLKSSRRLVLTAFRDQSKE